MIDIKNYLKSIYDSCIDGIFTSGLLDIGLICLKHKIMNFLMFLRK